MVREFYSFYVIICILYYAALQTFGFITNAEEQSITMIPQTRKRPFFLKHPAPLKHIKQYEGSISTLKTTDTADTHTEMDTSVQSLLHPEQKKDLKSKFVDTEFLNVKNQLKHNIILQSYDIKAMLEKCENLMTSDTNNIFLFSSDQLQKLTECKQAPELIQKLSPHFNWSNHSVLREVIGCNNTVATNLLDQFDSQIDSSLPVTDYPIPQPSPNMIPYDTSSHTVLAVKLNAELRSISLQQVFDIQHLLQEQFQLSPHTFQLLAANSVPILYWMIPKCAVSVITSSVTKHRRFLYQNGIMELSIYPGLIYATSDTVRVGSLSFLNHYVYFEVYNHSNMIVCLVSCYKYCTYSCIGFKIRANSSFFSIKQSGGVYIFIAFVACLILVYSIQEIPTVICTLQKELVKVKKEYLITNEEEKSKISKQVNGIIILDNSFLIVCTARFDGLSSGRSFLLLSKAKCTVYQE